MAHKRFAVPVSLVLLGSIASAQPGDDTPWSVTPLVGTDVGLDLAAGLQVEAPFRLRLMATVGWVPQSYAWVLKRYYVDVYDGREAVGNLLKDTVEFSTVFGTNLTLRPLAHHGLFFGGAYFLTHSDKSGLFQGELENAASELLPITARGTTARTFNTEVTVHMLGALVGWEWGIGSGFMLRASAGVVWIVSTRTTFEPNFTPSDPAATRSFLDDVEHVLEDAGTDVVAPTGSLFLGYTFR